MTNLLELTIFGGTAVGMALVSGVFLAFSDFVMRSLRRASPTVGIEAMQLINREVYGSAFLVALLGLVPVSGVLAVYAVLRIEGLASGWFVAGAAIYGIGVVLVTMLGNVPMNRRLDLMAAEAVETRDYWQHYARRWTRLNHLRTLASALAAAAFVAGTVLLV
ncbi:MAG: anthrone oxygenase family protein [Roseovarius sp.]|uniref:anthrone oxygenase family protein n=1 Tax=Roseovarius sp. TaxID=1486281 RepID=UPI00262ADF42|nr:anthrone oxygenase family protein [Roseovarius sp.]